MFISGVKSPKHRTASTRALRYESAGFFVLFFFLKGSRCGWHRVNKGKRGGEEVKEAGQGRSTQATLSLDSILTAQKATGGF